MNWRRIATLAIAVAGAISITQAQTSDGSQYGRERGFVYTETNGTNNAILVFSRSEDGELSLAAPVPTGGLGGGVVAVGSQGSLALTRDARWLFAANEGDDTISLLERTRTGLRLVERVSSNGTLPVSITVSGELVYVLNEGRSATPGNPARPPNITGFFFDDERGALYPIADSTRSLSSPSPTPPAVGPVAPEISFDNTGLFLYVTEVGTSLIDRYPINYYDGTPEGPEIETSFGNAPFAFAFDRQNNLLVTEVNEAAGIVGTGAVTSYRLNDEGILNVIDGSVPDFQTAPCWIAITRDGRFAYAVDTGNGVISGYRVDYDGKLSLLSKGVSATTGPHPLDIAFTRYGRHLYNVSGDGALIGFRVGDDGSLTPLGKVTQVPTSSRGLVAR